MSELTDDQLDGLFRKSAEEFDPPFDPAAWQDMKARLDTNDHTAPVGSLFWKNLLRWGLPIALLVLLTGGWYAYTKTQSSQSKPVVQTVSPKKIATDQSGEERQPVVETQPVDGESTRTTATKPMNPVVPNSQPAEETPAVTEGSRPSIPAGGVSKGEAKRDKNSVPEVSVATKSGKPAYSIKTDRGSTVRTRSGLPVVNDNQSEVIPRSVNAPRRQDNGYVTKRTRKADAYETAAFATTNYAFPTATSSGKRRVRRSSKLRLLNTISTSVPSVITPPTTLESADAAQDQPLIINGLTGKSARWAKPLPFVGRSIATSLPPDTNERTAVQAAPPIVQRGFSVRFAVAPDLSTVGLKNFSRPGTNVGLLLEYRLANRWSVQGGAIWSTKVYKAGIEDYVVPDGMWAAPMKKPESVDGRCVMFDIPLNVRYDFLLQPRMDGRLPSRWFVSGGLTTYIMNQEDYHYDYPAHTYGQKTDWTNPNKGTAFGLSNLNLSVGYERSFGKRLSWQVEPFMKVPLKGVGVYKINLLSTGSFFSIRYKL